MQVGMIGLGRMGANMVRRFLRGGHQCVVHDLSADAVRRLVAEGATGGATLAELVAQLAQPRVIWMMVPAAVVDATLEALGPLLSADDVVVDGGNSYYRDDIEHAQRLQARAVHYVDCGYNVVSMPSLETLKAQDELVEKARAALKDAGKG